MTPILALSTQGHRDKRDDDVTSKGEGDSGSSELTGKDIDDSLSADEDDDLPLPPPPAQLGKNCRYVV